MTRNYICCERFASPPLQALGSIQAGQYDNVLPQRLFKAKMDDTYVACRVALLFHSDEHRRADHSPCGIGSLDRRAGRDLALARGRQHTMGLGHLRRLPLVSAARSGPVATGSTILDSTARSNRRNA